VYTEISADEPKFRSSAQNFAWRGKPCSLFMCCKGYTHNDGDTVTHCDSTMTFSDTVATWRCSV